MAEMKAKRVEGSYEKIENVVSAIKVLNETEGFTVSGLEPIKAEARLLFLSETKDLIDGQLDFARKNLKRCAKAMAEKGCGEKVKDKNVVEKAAEIFDSKLEPIPARIEEVLRLCEMAEKQIKEFYN
jgi:hypothetical protein